MMDPHVAFLIGWGFFILFIQGIIMRRYKDNPGQMWEDLMKKKDEEDEDDEDDEDVASD